MKIAITGGQGMLAYDLIQELQSHDCDVLTRFREDCDITDLNSIKSALSTHQPDILINCAAYTAVDLAQGDGAQDCYHINTLGTANLAQMCHEYGIGYITISTDYVFGGDCPSGYLPDADCKPVNVYGMSKWLGEQAALLVNPDTVIVRTSWLYGGGSEHKHFVSTMLQLAQTRDYLTVVNDQHGLPMYTGDLSAYLYHIGMYRDQYRGRIVHATNIGDQITRYDFACEIFRQAGVSIDVQPCTTDQFPRPALRPQWSCLLSDDAEYDMPTWRDALQRYLQSQS